MATSEVILATTKLIDATYNNTAYHDKEDGQSLFSELRLSITSVCGSPEGSKIVQKFLVLGRTPTTEANFNDMVKIIWRMVKGISGTPMYRLTLLFLAIGAMIHSLSSGMYATSIALWMENLEKWLGKQLTTGGKGRSSTEEGEGKAVDRVQRFFSTPYLHEFD